MQFSFGTIQAKVQPILSRLHIGGGDGMWSLERRHTSDWLIVLTLFVAVLCLGVFLGVMQFFAVQESAKPKSAGDTPSPTVTLDVGTLEKALTAYQKKKSDFDVLRTRSTRIIDPSR